MNEYRNLIPDIREYLCSDCTGGCSSCIYTKWFKNIEKLIKENEKIKEALDNACDMLETYDLANNELTRPKQSKEEWKEWLLNDRTDDAV